jgi:putative addiction module component (TIGR02574 family)
MAHRSSDLLSHIAETEQLELAFEIWEKYAQKRIAIELSDSQKAELMRRLEVHAANPMAGRSWEDFKQDLVLA